MPCYWRQYSAYRHCRPPVLPTSFACTRKRRARAAVAGAAAAAERGGDRFGLGWRPELAAGILAHLDLIDLIEVIAEDYFDAPRRDLRALRTLAAQVGMVL